MHGTPGAVTPTPISPLAQPSCAALFRALADETRLALVRTLLGGGRSVSELCEGLGLRQSLASRHLGILRSMGMVLARRHAQRVIYELTPELRGKVTGKLGGGQRLDLGCCEVRFR